MIARATSVDVSDLVLRRRQIRWLAGGTDPNAGLDCAGLTLLVLRRCGFDVPDYALVSARSTTHPDETLAAFLAMNEASWALLGDTTQSASRAGDVIVSVGRSGPHCSTLVNAATRKAITISETTSVQLIGVDRIAAVQAVYRWTGALRP